jgi:transposase
MAMQKRKRYTINFKKEAVRQVIEEGRSAVEVERLLGTGKGIIARWVRELSGQLDSSAMSLQRVAGSETELNRLKEELVRCKIENRRLKNAIKALTLDDPTP